jgi:hypothetical protein
VQNHEIDNFPKAVFDFDEIVERMIVGIISM